jgi:DNA replication protein DnaC
LDVQSKVLSELKSDPFKPRSLMGPTGVGKTYLLCALAREAILNGRNIFFTRMNVLVRAMKDDEYGHLTEERAHELISPDQLQADEWGRPSNLYIDEFDKASGSKDTYTRVFDLVNLCYEFPARVSLFTTTNLNSDEFLEEWGAALYRRIQEISPFIHLYRE